MKNIYKGILVTVMAVILLQPVTASERDTVTINFGNNSKMVIQFKDKDELKRITQYDINKMLMELSLSVDSTENVTSLRIEDEEGTRYLNDPSDIEEEVEEEVEEEEEDWNHDRDDDDRVDVRLRLGSIVLRAEGDQDDLEDTVEDWEHGNVRIKKEEREEERKKKNTNHFNVDIGLNNYLQDGEFPSSNAPFSVRPWGSWNVALNSVHRSAIAGPLFLEWGAGFSWYNFKLENDDFKVTQGANMVEFIDPVDIQGVKSKLTVSYFNLSFVPVLDFSKGKKKVKTYGSDGFSITHRRQLGFRIGAGVYGGYRLGSHSKFVSKTSDSGRDTDKDRDSFFLQNWRYGVRFQVGFKGTDLFVNYDLNELFEEGPNPKLNAISFGLIL